MVRSSRSYHLLADATSVGYCRRGANCWFRHTIDPNRKRTPEPTDEDELLCSICLDKPTTFGLLGTTFHVSYNPFETTNVGQADVVTYSASKYASAALKAHYLTEPAVYTSMARSRKQIRRSSELLQHQKVSHVSCSLKVYHSKF